MKKSYAVVLFIVLAIILAGMFVGSCKKDQQNKDTIQPSLLGDSEGVQLFHDLNNQDDYWLENINNYPVRVRMVEKTSFGEHTKAINVLQPKEKFKSPDILYTNGFYIYTMDGGLIGFVKK